MFAEWYKAGCSLEYPLDGSGGIVDALIRGLQKFGGRISLRSHVESIVVEEGRATGVKLRNGQVSINNNMLVCILKKGNLLNNKCAVYSRKEGCSEQRIYVGHY